MDQYIRKYDRITRKYERIYTKKFYRILRRQIDEYIQTRNVDAIQSDMVADALLELYLKAGGEWAFYVEKQLRKDKVIKRLPFSFNLRISRLIRNQFTPDILNMASNITQTTKDRIRTVLRDNLDASFDDIVKILRSPELTAARARLIARTETVGATNGAAMENARAFVVPMRKKWSAVLDGRTRKDHEKLDGDVVGMNEKFRVVDSKGYTREMAYPGDKEGGPGQVCNCRCVVVFVP